MGFSTGSKGQFLKYSGKAVTVSWLHLSLISCGILLPHRGHLVLPIGFKPEWPLSGKGLFCRQRHYGEYGGPGTGMGLPQWLHYRGCLSHRKLPPISLFFVCKFKQQYLVQPRTTLRIYSALIWNGAQCGFPPVCPGVWS